MVVTISSGNPAGTKVKAGMIGEEENVQQQNLTMAALHENSEGHSEVSGNNGRSHVGAEPAIRAATPSGHTFLDPALTRPSSIVTTRQPFGVFAKDLDYFSDDTNSQEIAAAASNNSATNVEDNAGKECECPSTPGELSPSPAGPEQSQADRPTAYEHNLKEALQTLCLSYINDPTYNRIYVSVNINYAFSRDTQLKVWNCKDTLPRRTKF